MKKTQIQGFTLIEMMIVVAIIGILAAIALPAYQDYLKRAYVVEAINLVSEAKSDISTHYGTHSQWPLDMTNRNFTTKAVESVTGEVLGEERYRLNILFKTGFLVPNDKGSIYLELDASGANGASLRWVCYKTANIDPKYVPATCRCNTFNCK